jgi:C-terminal processing protease CtpA/Prc
MLATNLILKLEAEFVREVTEKSGAEDAGIKKGDIITKIDNSKIDSFADLSAAIGSKRPGDKVTGNLFRSGKQLTSNVTLKDQKGGTSFRSKADLTVSEKIGGEFEELSERVKTRLWYKQWCYYQKHNRRW